MSDDRLRFRCYRCQQLISASTSKSGLIIACPKCKAELLVPRIDGQPVRAEADEASMASGVARERGQAERSRRGRQGVGSSPLPTFMQEIAAALPEELATLRPEDIRVEAEFAELVITDPEPLSLKVPPYRPSESPDVQDRDPEPVAEVRFQLPPDPPAPISPATDSAPGAGLPAIDVEPAAIRPSSSELRAVREVILQPATVLAWSLLVLMALPMAFIAGLMIGHFFWK